MRHVADEMEHVVILCGSFGLLFHDERILSGEAIMGHSDHLRVADGMASLFRGQTHREALKVGKLWADVDLRSIHKDRKDGLRSTCVVNDLVGEEKFRVVLCECLGFLAFRNPLKEEDQSVDRSNVNKINWLRQNTRRGCKSLFMRDRKLTY